MVLTRRFPQSVAALAISSALLLAACSRQEPTPAPQAETPPATQPDQTPPETAPAAAPAVPTVPTLRALDPTQRAEALAAAVDCNLESADSQAFAGADITLSTPSRTSVSGWLKSAAPMTDVALRIETLDKAQIWDVPISEMTAREDLATAADAGSASGFKLEFDASSLPSGRYHLYLVYRAGGALYGCDNGRHVAVL